MRAATRQVVYPMAETLKEFSLSAMAVAARWIGRGHRRAAAAARHDVGPDHPGLHVGLHAATVGEHGEFVAAVKPSASTSYHAVAGGEAGPPVQMLVLDRKVNATVRFTRNRVTDFYDHPPYPGVPLFYHLGLE